VGAVDGWVLGTVGAGEHRRLVNSISWNQWKPRNIGIPGTVGAREKVNRKKLVTGVVLQVNVKKGS
jgi:hypothetical protein